jgi:ABC-type Fe3+-siderophore transport system permease subunit
MWGIILREIMVFLGGLSVFVGVLVLGLAQGDSFNSAIKLLYRGVLSEALLRKLATDPVVWVKVLSPYLVIQVLRAYRWSQRSVTGRRWANVYFVVLLTGLAARSLWSMWDLFSFMYAMGDIPGELGQFFSLERGSILIVVACSAIAAHCLRIVLRPKR